MRKRLLPNAGLPVAEDLSGDPDYHDLCGFAETELCVVLETIAAAQSLDAGQVETTLDLMRDFYNGYRVSSQCEERVYNPTLALYFLKHLTRMVDIRSDCWTTTWQ